MKIINRIFFAISLILITFYSSTQAGRVFPAEEDNPVPGISESKWVYMTKKQKDKARENYLKQQEKITKETPSHLRYGGRYGLQQPEYLSVFAQCDAITEESSQEEIQAAITALEFYKKSEEVENFVETFSQPHSYKELAAEGSQLIQRDGSLVVNIPGKIEYYLSNLKEQLNKKQMIKE